MLVSIRPDEHGATRPTRKEDYMTNNNYVKIFDTTLRDGEQSPGATMTSAEKLELARSLARMGVDIIEAGFPAASPDDLEAVRRIAVEVGRPASGESEARVPIITGLARANKSDIERHGRESKRRRSRASIHSLPRRRFT